MYALSQRKKAVKLYIKFGLKAAPVINTLGYPDRRVLKSWYNEYVNNGKKFKLNHTRKSRYSDEQRIAAVNHYLDHGKNISYTTKVLGYPCRSVLSKWIYEDVKDHKTCLLKGKPLVKYSQEEKKEAALMVAIRDESMSDISKKSKARPHTLYNWKNKLVSNDLAARINDDKMNSKEVNELKDEIKELQQQVYQLQMEKDILEKACELIKKGMGIDIKSLKNKEKTIIINALKQKYKLQELLTALSISKSSYFYQCSSLRKDKYMHIRDKIKNIFDESYQSYGYRRIKNVLKHDGIDISEKVIRRLMKEEKLFVVSIKKKKYSSYLGEISPAVPNIIDRNFKADKPNEKLLTDITEFSIQGDKVYLSPMIDCFDGYVTSWTIGLAPNAKLVNTMLEDVIQGLKKDEKPIIHSDRGCHYRWPEWIKIMDDNGLTRSMSKKGCSPDNSACEGFFGRLKNEFYYNRDWKNTTTKEFMIELNKYIEWYNNKRIKESLGYMSPIEYRKSLNISY